MKDAKKLQIALKKDLSSLTPYHWQRVQESKKGVEQMLKQPYSLQQIRDQIQSNKESLRRVS